MRPPSRTRRVSASCSSAGRAAANPLWHPFFISQGWQLVAQETVFVELSSPPRVLGLPTNIGLAPESIALLCRISQVEPALSGHRVCPFSATGSRFTEASAAFGLIALPSLSPDRPLRVTHGVPSADVASEVMMRWLSEDIYLQDRQVPGGWVDQLTDRVPNAKVEGRIDSLGVVDELSAILAL
jgi:hypothetical protein